MTDDKKNQLRARADRIAFPMFMLSVLFLVLLASLIITFVDIPRVAELAEADGSSGTAAAQALAISAQSVGQYLLIALLCIWPLFWLELASSIRARRQAGVPRQTMLMPLLSCFIPPLRLAATSPAWDNRLWLPTLSWQHPGRQLSSLLQKVFSKPMLLIALLILPVLLFEFVFKNAINEHYWLRLLLHFSTGFIWFAFSFEFIIMISATDKKLAYIKKNWVDLAIILLPLISFLRTVRVLRLARLTKVQKLAKVGRIYRMRGLGMKAFRALLMFEVIHKVLRITPEKSIEKLKEKKAEMELDLAEIDQQISELETRLASSNQTSNT